MTLMHSRRRFALAIVLLALAGVWRHAAAAPAKPNIGHALHDRGILYAPDFVVNAGGIINIAVEKESDYDPDRARCLSENNYQTVTDIFAVCDRERLLPHQAAIRLAERRLHSAAPGCAPHAGAAARGMHPHQAFML